MRKIVFLLFIFIVIILVICSKEKYLIPDNAIRIRIIANSDDINDQKVKSEVKNKVNEFLYEKFQGIKTYKDADKVVKDNIREIDRIVSETANVNPYMLLDSLLPFIGRANHYVYSHVKRKSSK